MTRKLWRALRRPPATHPIFRRTVLLPGRRSRRYFSWASMAITLVLSLSDFMPTLLLLLIPIVLLVSGVLYGIECSMRVSHAIASERQNGTYQLLAMCPPGALAVCWVICTSTVYRNREFERLHEIIQASVNIALIGIIILFVLVVTISTAAATPYNNGAFTPPMLMNIGVVFAVMYWEFIQSVVLGCIIGILISTYTQNGLDASLLAPSVFLLIKMAVYALTALLGLSVLPDVFAYLPLEGSMAGVVLTVLRGLIFIGLQEGAVHVSWQHLVSRVNASRKDVQWALSPSSKG